MLKVLRAVIAFILFTLLGAAVAFLLHYAFTGLYPSGLGIDSWYIIGALCFFSVIWFFLLIMFVDLTELLFKPIRMLGGNLRVCGFAAIVIYIIVCLWALYELWVVQYNFHFSGFDSIVWTRFVMAILMSIVTIVSFGICITSAWGPKDLSKGSSS